MSWAAELHRKLHPRRKWVLAGFAILIAVSVFGSMRLVPRQDVLSLIGDAETGELADAVDIVKTFGAFDVLLIDVSKPGASRSELEETADRLVQRLEATHLFRRISFRVDQAGMRRAFDTLFAKRFFLLPRPDSLDQPLEAARRDLVSPTGFAMEELIARDPLDHRTAIIERLKALGGQMKLDVSTGTLISTDGAHALLIAEPLAKGLDIEAARETLAAIEREKPEGAVLEVLGAHVFSTSVASSIKRDVWASIAASSVTVLLLFLLYFRRVRPVIAASIPVAVAGLFTAGLAGWFGVSLHGITYGFSGVMLGIGIDYGMHLMIHYRARRGERPHEEPHEAMAHSLDAVFGTISIGAVTTSVAFLVLLLSGMRVLVEFVFFTTVGIAASLLLAIVVLPHLSWLMPSDRSPTPSAPARFGRALLRAGERYPVAASILILAMTPAALGIAKIRFDGNIRNLEYQPPEIRALEARIDLRYGNPKHPTLVVASASAREEALKISDRIAGILTAAESRGQIASFVSPSTLLASAAAQNANLAAYDAGSIAEELEGAAPKVELNAEVFAPFFEDLDRAKRGEVKPLDAAELGATPFSGLLERAIVERPGQVSIVTVVHAGGGKNAGGTTLPAAVLDALKAAGAKVVSTAALASSTVSTISRSIGGLGIISFLLVMAVLVAYYRDLRPAMDAILPTLISFGVAFGVMGFADIPLNVVSVGAFALVSGVSVDYGIFMTDAALRSEPKGLDSARASVTMAALTTILGFGSLLVAHSPVMWSLGFVVTIGCTVSYVCAVWLLPALWVLRGGPGAAPESCLVHGRRLKREGALLDAGVVLALAALSLVVIAAWLAGARSTHGGQVAITLLADVAAAIWIFRRRAKARSVCSECRRAEGRTDG